MEDPLGEHYIIELFDCNKGILNDLPKIRETLLEAARMAGATIIDSRFHQFSPQGVSGMIVIAESHLSIHTWPELGYAALDVFTCSHTLDMEAVLEMLRDSFEPGELDTRYIARGILDRASRMKSDLARMQRVLV